ncbi:hypothetical protein HY639_00745 [Candidatus Woesearchaeota archaeon]|nr:hypothetical protein [Candidatus Woesearchaeota archaeon]
MTQTLEELVDVDLPAWGTYKFILVKVGDNKSEKSVLVGRPGLSYHDDVLAAYARTLPGGIQVQNVLGGGRIRVSSEELYAYGYSGSFGEAPQEEVENILKQYIEQNKLPAKLKVEMGKGY